MEDTILLSTVGSPTAHVQMHRFPLFGVCLYVCQDINHPLPYSLQTGSVAEPGVRLAMNKPHCEQLVSTPPQCCGKGKHRVILGFLCSAEDLNSDLTFAQQMPSPTKPSP